MPVVAPSKTAENSETLDDVTRLAAEPGDADIVTYEDAVTGSEAILPDYEDLLDDAWQVSESGVKKDELVGVPFIIYDFSFRQGKLLVNDKDPSQTMPYVVGGIPDRETGEIIEEGNRLEFVIVRAVTAPGSARRPDQPGYPDADSEHVVFADGGTGVYKTLKDLYNKRGVVRIRAKRGLRMTEYEGPHGGPAKTYHIA